jgi:hypothetical protein
VHIGGSNILTGEGRIKLLRFDGSMSWTIIYHQFKAVAGHNNWSPQEKAMHLFAILRGQPADIVQSIPAEVTY